MVEEIFNFRSEEQHVEHHLVTLFEKLETIRKNNVGSNARGTNNKKVAMQIEIRTLEFWRSVISECMASFIYVFVVCGAAAGAGVGASISSVLLATALASGFAMTFLTQFFGHISGAHINPSVSIAMGVIKRISFLRACMFILAQCGGGIAGAAFLYGVTVPGHQANLLVVVGHSANIAPWERFGVEFILTFIVVYSYFVSMDTYRKWTGTSCLTIGSTYSACSFVSMPYLNPARSLGPSFVLNRWENHWVYWLGPMLGGLVSGLIYEYIFNPNRSKKAKESHDDESSSMHSDEDINYDDLDKPQPPKFHGSTYNTYRSANAVETRTNYCPSLYSAPPAKLERVESLYGGTKSLYCKSPPLTRANLNRSQSVYAKSNNSSSNRDLIPKPGPLVPAQSLYPIKLSQQTHVQNQNVHNQLQQRSENYGWVRGVTPGTSARSETYGTAERPRVETATYNSTASERPRIRENFLGAENPYGTRTNPSSSESSENNGPIKPGSKAGNRPESMYGMLGSQRSYQKPSGGPYTGPLEGRSVIGPPPRPVQNAQISSNNSSSASYHHQHSPNPQY